MKCRFEHDGDCCNSGATQYMCKCKQPCDTIVPITNADRIRAMSDEELEQFINHFNICDIRTNEECKMSYCACCEVCVMDWLQQPAEDE